MEVLYRGNPQNFDGAPARSPLDYGTFTSYEPAATYSLVTTPLKYGIFLDTEMQAARLKRDFEKDIWDQSSFEADRAYAKIDFSRPIKLGVMNFVPHLGGQQAYYDTTAAGGSAPQGALTYGLDATTRVYGLFPDLENDALGLKGRTRGGASVSEKHANFIVNDRKGTAADVRSLIDEVAATVERETGIVLAREVVFLGDWGDWGDTGDTGDAGAGPATSGDAP